MKSIKAILAGSLFIIITVLIIQLAIVFLIVGYNSLAGSLPVLHEISSYFRYLLAYPVFFFVLFMGGYLTARIAQTQILLHCLVVGIITVGLSTVAALDYMVVTSAGVVLVMLALLAIIVGGLYWRKNQNR